MILLRRGDACSVSRKRASMRLAEMFKNLNYAPPDLDEYRELAKQMEGLEQDYYADTSATPSPA